MNRDSLKNKKILYISIKTFNYEVEIANKLRDLGSEVDYFDERPSNSLFVKGVIRLKRSFYKKKINFYYKKILKKIEGKEYDFFFLIKGEVIPAFFLKELREKQKKCIFIYYTWDSFDNNPNGLAILPLFDKKITFDNFDAEKYNIEFRPLFYIDKYKNIQKNNENKYKLLFLGTAHSDRYKISNEIVNWCDKNNFSTFAYYYMQSKLVYFFKSKFDASFKAFDYKKLSFSSLNADNIVKLYSNSSIILDINHPNQKGLTMRTFEALGAGKKIITTNKEIIKYSFYNENNVFIIDRYEIQLLKSFFTTNFIPIDKELLEEMSITGWLQSIFIDNKKEYWIN
jgi:hypothetical protein